MRLAHDHPEDWEDIIEAGFRAGDELRKARRANPLDRPEDEKLRRRHGTDSPDPYEARNERGRG